MEGGAALLAGGRFLEALAAFTQDLHQQPGSLAARIGIAQACAGAGDLVTATAWLSDAVRLAPGQPQPLQLLADMLLAQQLPLQALPPYLALLARFGQRGAANLLHAGFCQEQAGDIDAAAALYREALQVEPALMEAEVDLAGVLWRLEDFQGSLAHAQRAVELAPNHAYTQRILGTALLNLNRLDEAEQHLRRALQLQPGLRLAQLDLAFVLLLAGRLPEGWQLYETRWQDRERLQRPHFYRPESEWPGPSVDIAGKAIAVYAEQGLGDVLQCLRYLPMLQALGAEVRCVLQPELVALVEESFPGVQCLRPGRDITVQWHIAMMELPGHFGTTLETIPAAVPYLRAPAAARERWRQRLAPWTGRRKIGLAWSGSLVQVNNRNRAIPLSLLQPLTDSPGVQCFSLQKADAGPYTDTKLPADALVDLTGDWADFSDSAAMLEQLDLVITIDTAIAHLAGALGKPVWLLLPPNADWRWLLDRSDSPWYPSARLFRRGFGEPRQAQVARVRNALDEWLAR
jgi:tetratricopeptide (TPR) repeat protein